MLVAARLCQRNLTVAKIGHDEVIALPKPSQVVHLHREVEATFPLVL